MKCNSTPFYWEVVKFEPYIGQLFYDKVLSVTYNVLQIKRDGYICEVDTSNLSVFYTDCIFDIFNYNRTTNTYTRILSGTDLICMEDITLKKKLEYLISI